jgi:two-component system NtrC family sensor kinase
MSEASSPGRAGEDAPVLPAGPPLWRWLAAGVLGAAAMALRAVFDPWLDGGVPFVFAFPAVVTAALLAGPGPALLTLLVCTAIPFLSGLHEVLLVARSWQQAGLFVASGLVVIALCSWRARHGLRSAADALAAAAAPDEPGRYAQLWLRVLIALALLLPSAFFVSAAWQGYRSAMRNAEERVVRSAVIAREHALKIMSMNQLIFDRMRERFDGRTAAEIAAARPVLEAALAHMVHTLPDVAALAVWDREGRPLALSVTSDLPSTLSAAQREYFQVQREADRGLFVAAPVQSQVQPGQWRIVVSQRRNGPRGEFDGVYAISLGTRLFNDFYQDLLRDEHNGTVALFRPDGTIITRQPQSAVMGQVTPASGPLMQRVRAGDRAGLLSMRSPVDGRERLAAFRQVGSHPLYVLATVAHETLLASWYREVALLAAFTFPTALGLAWVSWIALGHVRRERLALERWRAETVRRAQAEDALRQTQRLEALGHLTGGVAHDVNNLLMVVSNNAYLLRRLLGKDAGAIAPRAEKPIDAILRAVTTGSRLTRQLLAFARRQALRPEVVRLQDRMPLLLDLMRHSVTALVSLEGEVAPDTHCIQVDPAELELALINLAVNARDAMPEGGTLRVEARNAEPGEHQGLGAWVSITVRDSGVGIPPEVLDHVFEPFFTTKEQGKGTGLGLSQVYGFCLQAGGTARISSAPGQGTSVQLLLPGVSSAPDAQEEPPPVPMAHGRLLLVEDNAEVAEATEPMLSSWGYSVRGVRSGDAAKEQLAQHKGGFELLLTDIVMPGATDGLSLARHVRAAYPHIGIVLMTGHARETDKAMAEGFVVLQKPWTPSALAAALEQAHPRQRAAGENT